MLPKISYDEFECLVRRAGLTLTQAEMTEMHQAFAVVEAMAERVRTPRALGSTLVTPSVDQSDR